MPKLNIPKNFKSAVKPEYTQVFRFSPRAYKMTYSEWINTGGCSVPNASKAFSVIRDNSLTLKQISDECPHSERSLARYAYNEINKNLAEKVYIKN